MMCVCKSGVYKGIGLRGIDDSGNYEYDKDEWVTLGKK
jgi:hypothetical protein